MGEYMSIRKTWSAFAVAAALTLTFQAGAFAEEKHKNLKVLEDNGKVLEQGMKAFSKGLGVKCNACHVKGEFDSDKVEEKLTARKFLDAVVGEKDQAKRDAALKDLLTALKIKEAKDAKEVWAGIDLMKKK
jgi:hypothetical protein